MESPWKRMTLPGLRCRSCAGRDGGAMSPAAAQAPPAATADLKRARRLIPRFESCSFIPVLCSFQRRREWARTRLLPEDLVQQPPGALAALPFGCGAPGEPRLLQGSSQADRET